jgi:signal peptidase II
VSRPVSRWAVLGALFALLVLADQWTKFLAVERLTTVFERTGATTLGEKLRGFYDYEHLEPFATAPHYVYRPVWRMNYVENPGAAWGLFRGMSEGFRNVFFTLVSLGAIAFIVQYYRKLRDDQRFLQVALAFVLAGAVGNFIDRIARRYVVDFVEWYWWNRPDLRWPTFNVADALIVVGVAMLIVHPGPKKVREARPGEGDATRAGEATSRG